MAVDDPLKDCPRCGQGNGIPAAAITALGGGVIVVFRCVRCRFEWESWRGLKTGTRLPL
jgi:hypothetical protein